SNEKPAVSSLSGVAELRHRRNMIRVNTQSNTVSEPTVTTQASTRVMLTLNVSAILQQNTVYFSRMQLNTLARLVLMSNKSRQRSVNGIELMAKPLHRLGVPAVSRRGSHQLPF